MRARSNLRNRSRFAGKPLANPEEGSTDRWAVENGMNVLTSLRLELTDMQRLSELREAASPKTYAVFAEVEQD